MPRKPSQTMLTFEHATRDGVRAAVHTLPQPTPEGMTHYTTFQARPSLREPWRPMPCASVYATSLLIALRSLARAGYAVPPHLTEDREATP